MNSVSSEPNLPTVLVLDDEATMREVGRRFLQAFGYECVEAESVERAVEILRTTSVDAAILDRLLARRMAARHPPIEALPVEQRFPRPGWRRRRRQQKRGHGERDDSSHSRKGIS